MPAKGAIHSTSAPAATAVRLEGITRRYGAVEALAGVSLHAGDGEVVAVVGPSGCGKSTLLELVCGLQRPDEGTVNAAHAVLMPQRDLLLAWATALDNAALALRVDGLSRREARERAAGPRGGGGGGRGPRVSARPAREGRGRPRPHELSGGMRQRVAFLRT